VTAGLLLGRRHQSKKEANRMTKPLFALLALSLSLPNVLLVNAQTESRLTHSDGSTESGEYPSETGLYTRQREGWTDLLPEVVYWKTGGVLKSLATGGVIKGDLNGRLSGPHSRNEAESGSQIAVYVPDGVAITEYQLLRLRVHKDSREFRTVTGGIFHTSGGDTKDLVQFESRKVAPRTWLVTLTNLVPGEYGFLPPGAIVSANASSSLGKMYTFQVRDDAAATGRTHN
jgi:hypothetical protein